jgi:hypothetical protein
LTQLDAEHWAARAPAAAATTSPAAITSTPARRRRPPAVALALLALVLGVVLVVALASGGDDNADDATEAAAGDIGVTTPAKEEAPTVATSTAQRMQRLNGTYGHGTAQIADAGGEPVLRLRVSGFLQPEGGGYAVWLYNSGDDGRRLYATRRTTIERDLPLPSGYEDFRYVEVARAIPDLDSDHSGISLLRARVDELR